MKRKLMANVLLMALLTGSVLAGCSGSQPSSGGGQSAEAAGKEASGKETAETAAASAAGNENSKKEEANSKEKITLRFSWWGSDSRHQATLECIDAYMKENPNVIIKAEYGGFDGYQDKISAALAGGTEPDIIQLDQPWMSTFMAQNPDFFVNLNDYKDVLDLSGFSEDNLKDYCIYNDKLICLPTGLNSLNFLVNKGVLEKAGVEFGDTIDWNDILEQGKKVNQAFPDGYLLNNDSAGAYYVARIYLYQLSGAQIINDDYTLGVTVDQIAEAYEYTKKLNDEKVIIPLEESMLFDGSPQDNPKWNEDKMGGWFNWASTTTLQNWGDNAVVLPYPVMDNAKDSGIIIRPSQVFSVSNNCKNPEEAVKFLDFMFNEDAGILALKDSRSIPACEHARNLLQEKGLVSELAVKSIDLANQNPGTPENNVPNTTEVFDTFQDVLEKYVYGQYTDVKEAAQDAYDTMSKMLEMIKADNS
ncbi:MAG: extracellular solute-binding protein [Clostridiaceae bacterium]|nr:extracellular solute-binding protein [Clostridiaceae bacterium]